MLSEGIELTIQLVLISLVLVGLTGSAVALVTMSRRLARVEEALELFEATATSEVHSARE